MSENTRVPGGLRETGPAEVPPAPGMANPLFGYAEFARVMLWSVESARMMLDLNRTLLDIGQDMLRRQQDAAIASALQALGGTGAAPSDPASAPDVVSGLVRQSFDSFDRMMAAMRAANVAALGAANETSAAAPGERSPGPMGRPASR